MIEKLKNKMEKQKREALLLLNKYSVRRGDDLFEFHPKHHNAKKRYHELGKAYLRNEKKLQILKEKQNGKDV